MSKKEVQSVTVKGNCKRKPNQHMTSWPGKIIHRELISIENVTGMNNTESVVSNDPENIRLAKYRERRKHLTTISKNIAEVLQQLKDSSLLTSRKEQFCFVDEDTLAVLFFWNYSGEEILKHSLHRWTDFFFYLGKIEYQNNGAYAWSCYKAREKMPQVIRIHHLSSVMVWWVVSYHGATQINFFVSKR